MRIASNDIADKCGVRMEGRSWVWFELSGGLVKFRFRRLLREE